MNSIELSNQLNAKLVDIFAESINEKLTTHTVTTNNFDFVFETIYRDNTQLINLCIMSVNDVTKQIFLEEMKPLFEAIFAQMKSKYSQLQLEYALKIKTTNPEKPFKYVFTEYKFNNDFTMDCFLKTEYADEWILSILGLKVTFN